MTDEVQKWVAGEYDWDDISGEGKTEVRRLVKLGAAVEAKRREYDLRAESLMDDDKIDALTYLQQTIFAQILDLANES